jgi:hypothetical protein
MMFERGDDARYQLAQMRDGVSLETYLDTIWARRDEKVGIRRSTGSWPIRRADELPLPNVSRMKTRTRP